MDELERSQAALGQAVDRAKVGEDRELADQVRDTGERMVRQLFGLLRMTRTHDLANDAFIKPMNDFTTSLGELVDLLGQVNMTAVEGQVYMNDIRIRLDEGGDLASKLGKELRRHRIGGIVFHGVPPLRGLRAVVEGFADDPDPQRPRTALQDRIEDAGGSSIELQGIFRFRVSGEQEGGRQIDGRELTQRAADFVDAAVDNLGADRIPNPLPMRRVVTDIADSGIDQAELWDESASASPFGNHTLRITLLAMLIADGLGLTGEAIQDLGVVAMFHDIGYSTREGAIPASGDDAGHPGYAPPFSRHASAGARVLLRQRGFHSAKIVRALTVLQHHVPHDDEGGCPHLFARILHIAESYDALTTRARGPRLSPPEALQRLQAYSNTRYDPTLVQILINAMGAYPPGTMLQLVDSRIVESVGLARGEETWARPMVRVRWDPELGEPEEDVLVDLAKEGKVRWALSSRGKPMLR